MTRRRQRSSRPWLRRGPSILGYQPGWIWFILTGLVIGAGVYLAMKEVTQTHATAEQIDELIIKHAQANDLPVELVRAVVEAESGGDPLARSEVDARGLMQVTHVALKDVRQRFDLPKGDLYNPDYNLHIGTTYLRYLLDRFDNDRTLALAAYHMGPTRVARYLRQSPGLTPQQLVDQYAGPKTRAYVKRITEDLAS